MVRGRKNGAKQDLAKKLRICDNFMKEIVLFLEGCPGESLGGILAGWLTGSLAGRLAGCGWLAGWPASWLAGWPAGLPAGWPAGWRKNIVFLLVLLVCSGKSL